MNFAAVRAAVSLSARTASQLSQTAKDGKVYRAVAFALIGWCEARAKAFRRAARGFKGLCLARHSAAQHARRPRSTVGPARGLTRASAGGPRSQCHGRARASQPCPSRGRAAPPSPTRLQRLLVQLEQNVTRARTR